MKNIFTKAGFVAVLLLGTMVSSCDLDRFPKNKIEQGNAFKNITDAISWENGMMASFRGRGWLTFAYEAQADEFLATKEYQNAFGAFQDWSRIDASNRDASSTYRSLYGRLDNVNLCLENIPNIPVEKDNEKHIVRIMGKSYFLRAYYFSELAKYFTKAYDPATAATDLGVVMPLKYDIYERYDRVKLDKLYAQILEDLDKAESLLDGVKIKNVANSTHITLDAVKALRARVTLYMQNWDAAAKNAEEIIESGIYELMEPTEENMYDMWKGDGLKLKESILQPIVTYPDEGSAEAPEVTSLAMRLQVMKGNKIYFQSNYLPTQDLLDMYSDSDLRKNAYFRDAPEAFGNRLMMYSLVHKFAGNPKLANNKSTFTGLDGSVWNSKPDGRMRPKVFRLAEQYLIAAEAEYRKGDESKALGYLNALRKSRGLGDVAASGDSLFEQIKEERQRELFCEGFRLQDIKRWNINMKRGKGQKKGVGSINEWEGYEPKADDAMRIVWPIPEQDIQEGLEQNPGY